MRLPTTTQVTLTLLSAILCCTMVSLTEYKYSSDQTTQDCQKDSTQEHCLKSDHGKISPEESDDGEPEFYEDDDVMEEDPAAKWKGRETLFQWDPVEVGLVFLFYWCHTTLLERCNNVVDVQTTL